MASGNSSKAVITQVNGNNGLNAAYRTINANFDSLKRAMNTPKTREVYYDNNHTLARVVIGKPSDDGKQVIAISKEGIDVLKALAKSPINNNDFIFSTEIVNNELERIEEILVAVLGVCDALRPILSNIEDADLSNYNAKVAALRSLLQD